MLSFLRFFGLLGYQILMDFFGMEVVDMRVYDIYSVFYFLKILILLMFSQKFRFSRCWGQHLKMLKFRDSHFIERDILHLYCSVCVVCFKPLILANFLTLSRFWSKLVWSDPKKNVNFSKFAGRFLQRLFIWCQIDVLGRSISLEQRVITLFLL